MTAEPRSMLTQTAIVLSSANGTVKADLKHSVEVKLPGTGNALIRILASKVNPSDLLNIRGGFTYTRFPRIPGRDYAGTVVQCPSEPSWEGKFVWGSSGDNLGFSRDGAHAQYMEVPTEALSLAPAALDCRAAASTGVPYTTALLMIERARIQVKDKVLIIGQRGNVGTALTRLLEAQFNHALAIAGANRNSQGIILPDEKYNAIFCVVPDTTILQESIKRLDRRGRLIFIATTRPNSPVMAFDPLHFYRNDLTISGVNSINMNLVEVKRLMDQVKDLCDVGLDLTYLADSTIQEFKLIDALTAYKTAETTRENVVLVTEVRDAVS